MGGQHADVLTVRRGVSERAARYDAWLGTPLGSAMDAAEPRAVLELADPRPGDRALDAGCGTGLYTRRLGERGATLTAASLERNDAGRLRVRGTARRIALVVEEARHARMRRCLELFADFGVVTQSVHGGIEVDVTVDPQAPAETPHDQTTVER